MKWKLNAYDKRFILTYRLKCHKVLKTVQVVVAIETEIAPIMNEGNIRV